MGNEKNENLFWKLGQFFWEEVDDLFQGLNPMQEEIMKETKILEFLS
jgi:hypothetical protein